jgi:hypothetical protein
MEAEMPQGGAGKQAEDGQRGSERMLRERELPEKQIQQLLSLSQRNARLVYWFPKGQPVPDAVYGAVIVPPDRAGRLIDRYLKIEGLGLRLDVFPLGIPVPEEVLIRFQQGFGH